MRLSLLACTVVAASLSLTAVACGGGSASGEGAKTATTKASMELEPLAELEAIPKDLDADAQALTKPIDDVQAILDDLQALPKKHGLTKAQVMAMAKASFESGKVTVSFDAAGSAKKVSDEAKAEVEAVMKRLVDVVAELKATPDKVTALTKKAVTATAKVPVLATKVTASATATASNPFGSAEGKAKAKADLDAVKQVEASTSKSISDVKSKITGMPEMATKALAKITTTIGAS